jgi:hypothetical protein
MIYSIEGEVFLGSYDLAPAPPPPPYRQAPPRTHRAAEKERQLALGRGGGKEVGDGGRIIRQQKSLVLYKSLNY